MSDLFQSLFQHATSQGSRSTALNPLAWALGICLAAFLVALRVSNLTPWVLPLLASLVVIFVFAFVISYFILLFKDRDALRSERFKLSKMALERSLTGDSLTGFAVMDTHNHETLLTASKRIEQIEGPQ